ncbi:hypothetical protein DFH07DRAFT_766247 [Mycena maculata]|uniref:Uncharacterized protein n=1 Tax=Mycena maculata TaxID=230809 RepID=A0AAD7K463_9AGAR|nr:hypothetical protein DFH07DRAFT_766247 [Mycena maculata]
MEMVKFNPHEAGDKPIRVVDTAAFETKVLKESDMDRALWTEVAVNYVDSITVVEGAGSTAEARWHAHFTYYTTSETPHRDFLAIRASDIKLRNSYTAQPFAFTRELYERDLQVHVTEQRIAEGLALAGLASPSLNGVSSSAPPVGPPPPQSLVISGRGGGYSGRRSSSGGSRGSDKHEKWLSLKFTNFCVLVPLTKVEPELIYILPIKSHREVRSVG